MLVLRTEDVELWQDNSFEQVRNVCAGEPVHAIITSPPYADARPDVARVTPESFAEWLTPLLDELRSVLMPNGSMMLNLGRVFRNGEESSYHEETVRAALELGWRRVDTIVWRKLNGLPPSNPLFLHNVHEYVYWLAPDPLTCYRGFDTDTREPYSRESMGRYTRRFNSDRKGEDEFRSERKMHPDGARPKSVFECAVGRTRGIRHPTPMALELARHLVSLSCPAGGVVLDPFAGSGTTAVAARERGRKAILIESERAYVDEAVERLAQSPLLATP